MQIKNRYCNRSRISEAKFREIIKYFSLDLEAQKIRERMEEYCEEDAKFSGVVEVDESYFGPRRVRGKRGRGAANKIPVFGILKRGTPFATMLTTLSLVIASET